MSGKRGGTQQVLGGRQRRLEAQSGTMDGEEGDAVAAYDSHVVHVAHVEQFLHVVLLVGVGGRHRHLPYMQKASGHVCAKRLQIRVVTGREQDQPGYTEHGRSRPFHGLFAGILHVMAHAPSILQTTTLVLFVRPYLRCSGCRSPPRHSPT